MIRKLQRRGQRVLALDICYRNPDGTKGRLRRDCEVQTMAGARAEELRVLACIAQYGSPYAPIAAPTTTVTFTFADAVKAWREGAAHALKATTRSGYEEILTTRLLPRWRDAVIDTINFDAVSRLDADMVREELSPSRRRNVVIVVRSVLRYAADAGHIAERPKLPAMPKKGRTILAALTMADVEKILAAASPAARPALALAAFAGLRAGEARGLRWSDVDMAAGVLVVRRSTSKGTTDTPKSGHAREVPMPPQLVAILAPARQQQGNALVTSPGEGAAWGESGLVQAMRRAVAKAGVPGKWRFHDLRHAYVTSLFRAGGSAPAVQALAGHLHLATTARYAHTTRADLRATVALLGQGNGEATAS